MALTVQERKFESSEKELLSFGLKAPDSTKIEINYDKITVQVPKGTDLTKLVSIFTSSEKSKVYVNNVLQVSGVTANNFANNTVEYVVVAEDGSTKTYYVTVNYCKLNYTNIYFSQEAYCPNQEINFSFSGMNSDLIKEKNWNFGNGKYFTQNNPYGSVQTSYNKKGIYTVSVSYINSQCFNSLDTTSVQVTISDTLRPNADFYLSKTSFCPNEPFSANASTYNEVSYTWDMGDKTIYTGSNINHAYKEEWDNTIKLTVTNACGNTSTTSKIVKVNKNASSNDNSNSYIYSNDVACIGEPISFSASGTYQNILWNFKDNSANETTPNPTHSFKLAGEYLVQAKLTDYCGVPKTVSKTITIKSSMPFTNIQSLNERTVCPNEKVYLYYNQYTGSIKNYTWILPNNEIVQGQNVEKTFGEGENAVYLKLTNYCGNDTMLSTKINVTRNIPISTYNSFVDNQETEFCPNEEFSIRYNSAGIKSYAWTGKGLVNQENGYAGYFKLSNFGEYTMQLKLTSFCGKDTILTKKITIVNNKPIDEQFSDYTFNKSYCPGEEVYFSKTNYENNYKLEEYNYGDGKQGTSNTHIYDAFGEYLVKLKLTNYCNVDTTIQATVHIAPVSISPSTSIYVSGNNSMQEEIYCQFDEIRFGISDYQGASIKSVIWNFGDGTPEVDNSNPTHIFAKSGLLTVKARLTSYCGDTLTIFKKISTRTDVGYKGYIDENIPNAVCPGENANFSIDENFKAVAWDFGDKTQSTAKNAVHSYAKMGTYPITLKLTNNCNVDTILNYSVEVRNDVTPDIDLDAIVNEVCPGEKVVFFQSADSRDYALSYDFGDNTKEYTVEDSIAQENLVIVSHKYLTKGNYIVKLTAKNKCGLTATETATISVQDGMKLNASSDLESGEISEDTMIFLLESNGAEFTWNFGKNDIVKTDVGFIKHGFSSTGDKNISVFVKTACGDTATYHTQVTITKVTTIANVTSCGNYLWNNKVYTQSGTYSNVYTNKQGFDSIVTLQLAIYAPSKSTTVYKAKGSYTWNGMNYTQSGVYTYTTKNVHGCDSVATLELTIESQGTSTTSIATCGSYEWNGKKYTQSGSYTYTTKNAQGNDSIATLLLTILPATSSSTNFTANGVYIWNGNTYSTSGVYTFTSKNANGCDSIATLVLTINAPGKSTTVVSACDNYTWNGKTYIQSGVFTFTTKTNSGADSTATLLLTISSSSSTSFNHTACGSYVWNGTTYTKGGKYVVTAKNTKGCDSTITLNLSINEVPSVLTGIQNGALFATQTNATYQWLNCDVTNSTVKDATNQAFLPTQTGNYAVQVTKNGCVDTSICISFETQSTSGIKDVQEARFTIYPNPNQGVFHIAGLPTGTYKILNLMGAVVFDFTVENSDVQLLNLSHLAKGVYQVASEDIKIMHNKVVIMD
jgi:PKD repeat protein